MRDRRGRSLVISDHMSTPSLAISRRAPRLSLRTRPEKFSIHPVHNAVANNCGSKAAAQAR